MQEEVWPEEEQWEEDTWGQVNEVVKGTWKGQPFEG
jgi:hypothetical protein